MSDSDRMVCLQHGLVVPREAFDLVLAMERKGITLELDGCDVIVSGNDHGPTTLRGFAG